MRFRMNFGVLVDDEKVIFACRQEYVADFFLSSFINHMYSELV